ncbi:unnamed protein product [Caenorhabditis angaria]|uniref:Calponin-homology (CH) domain-containing protein n=1 Tax=Caenorhabditis angaria TaxID=860376 RepID=A0A9P1J1J5_9PELO|nr:unnamed protein product [Caenorhabditis angaria]
MLTFSWTGKRKKKSDASDHAASVGLKHKSSSDLDSSEPSVSRSTTSTGSIHFGQTTPYTSSVGTSFKEAEYSGRLLLHGLRLTEFPVEALSNVELLDIVFIDLSDNRLSTLPADFAVFDCLISCIANSNRFRTIPTCICSIEQLTYLDFSFNEISHLPDSLFDLPLTTLLLTGNKIATIPEAIRRLAPTLAYLDLSRNEIRNLQSHLRFLKSLKVLKIARNHIEEFPMELCTSLELRTLDLSQNNLTYLPLEMAKMSDLRNLQLSCNPLKSPPIQVVERGIVHVFKWLEGRTSGSSSSSSSQRDCSENRKMNVMKNENELRNLRNASEPVAHHNGLHRLKEIVEPPANSNKKHVQIVHNRISSVPSNVGKENNSRQSTPDEQNNNNNKVVTNNLSSPGLSKKPISKVAPIMKNTIRPPSSGMNGNNQTKLTTSHTTTRRAAPATALSKSAIVKKENIPVTKPKTITTRKSEEPAPLKAPTKLISASSMALNKNGSRTPPASDVENARKMMRDKLGPSFTMSKGDMSFSLQISDGVELCKFVNKISPEPINIATNHDSSIATIRAKMNADKFVQYCKKIGVPDSTICSPLDILSKRNPQKIARTILSVAKLQALQVSPTNSIQC